MYKHKLIYLLFFFFLITRNSHSAEVPVKVKQGQIARIVINPGKGVTSVMGRLNGKIIPYFQAEKGTFVVLIGIDMDQGVGSTLFSSTWTTGGKTIKREFDIEVQAEKFGLQKLTLPKKRVDLDPPTLARVKREKGLMRMAFGQSINKKLWKGAFVPPVEGKRQRTFGRRRLINGKPRRSHTGEDISAPTGTPVLATNSGKVVLVGHFFFNGRSIVIDHGLGMFSMYFHLSEVDVFQGEWVKGGDQIGRVGSSGRVTGPHLHWGMRLNSARIDPYALVGPKLD